MKRLVLVAALGFILLLLCVPVASASSAGASGPVQLGDPPASAPAAWTVALYVDADNNLERMWDRYDVPELKRLPLDPRVNVVALVDRQKSTGVQLVRFGGGEATVLARYPERDFGSPATLQWFLRKMQKLYPAERLFADVWDHGGAWQGLCWDDTSHSRISMAELRGALTGAAVPVEILSCDTCFSADVTLAYDVSTTATVQYLVASEESVPGDGFCYDAMLEPLIADPAMATEDVLKAQVDGYERYYLGLPFLSPTQLSAVDLGKVRDMLPDLQRWSAALTAALPAEGSRLATDVRRSPCALWPCQVDLGAVARRMAADEWLSSDEVRAASAVVADDVGAAVVAEAGSPDVARHTGMTIWWGVESEWSQYRRMFARETSFAQDAGWYAFLRAVHVLGPRGSWFSEAPPAGPSSMNDVVFSDRLHGEAVGFMSSYDWPVGVVLRTDDGGATWALDNRLDASGALTGLAPFGDRLVSVGSSGYERAVLVRIGGGEKLAASALPSSAHFFDVDAAGARTAWTCGDQTLLATINGGKSWRRLATAPPGRLTSVALADTTHGWVVSEDLMRDSSAIYASADGGTTFALQYAAPGVSLRGLQALSAQEAWACGGDRLGGSGVILHTADGGATWSPQLSGADVPRISAVWMRAGGAGWAVGEGGAVYSTGDDGATWQRSAAVPTSADLNAVTFSDARHGCIVGDGGVILVTADGGVTWADHAADVTERVTPRWAPQVHGD